MTSSDALCSELLAQLDATIDQETDYGTLKGLADTAPRSLARFAQTLAIERDQFRAALKAVLGQHERDVDPDDGPYCVHCSGLFDDCITYPCSTVRVVAEQMGSGS